MKSKRLLGTNIFIYLLFGAVVLSVILGLLYWLFNPQLVSIFKNMEEISGFSMFGVLDVQISVTFIVVSIVTVFSQRSITIYWEDIMKYKLVKPMLGNFIAMSSYLFADLLFSIVLVVIGNRYIYITFFVSLLVIMVLSLKMIEAFFARDYIRNDLRQNFAKDKKRRFVDKNARINYREHKRKLIQYTIQAIDNNDIDIVCDNMDFLYGFDEDEDTTYLIQRMFREKKIYLLSRVAKTCQAIFCDMKDIIQFDGMCRELLETNPEETCGYVKSIYKSMGEYITENNCDNLQEFEQVITNIRKTCEEKGLQKLASEISENYDVQVKRMSVLNEE